MSLDGFNHYTLSGGELVGCEHPAVLGRPQAVLEALADEYNVQAVLTLTPRFTDFALPQVRQFHVPMAGLPSPAELERAMAVIDFCCQANEVVCVHCQRGLDRTACVLGCWLVRQGAEPETVIAELLSKFPPACCSERFRELWRPCAEIIRHLGSSVSSTLEDPERRVPSRHVAAARVRRAVAPLTRCPGTANSPAGLLR